MSQHRAPQGDSTGLIAIALVAAILTVLGLIIGVSSQGTHHSALKVVVESPAASTLSPSLRATGPHEPRPPLRVTPAPTQAAPVLTLPAQTAPPVTYTVKRGDNLSIIAWMYHLPDYHPLYDNNRQVVGPNPRLIYAGQVLVIPPP